MQEKFLKPVPTTPKLIYCLPIRHSSISFLSLTHSSVWRSFMHSTMQFHVICNFSSSIASSPHLLNLQNVIINRKRKKREEVEVNFVDHEKRVVYKQPRHTHVYVNIWASRGNNRFNENLLLRKAKEWEREREKKTGLQP